MSQTPHLFLRLKPRWSVVAGLYFYTLALRLLPFVLSHFGFSLNSGIAIYPWNFSPLIAVCLFGGCLYRSCGAALVLPVAMMIVGDLLILAVTGRPELVSMPVSLSVYGSILVCTALGFFLREQRTSLGLATTGLLGCLLFFVATNTVVWATFDTYSHDVQGLRDCYVAGLPYLRNTMISTALFTTLLFSPAGVQQRSEAVLAAEAVTV